MATDANTVQAYNKNAYAWAGKMRSGKNYAHVYIEKPAMSSLIPDLTGKKLLAVGCGSGEEIDLLRDHGATDQNIVGIDIAEALIAIARITYPDVSFHTMDMEKISFDNNGFDFVYSSLALHYIEDWTGVLAQVYRCLKPGGKFLFSTHHPMRWGSTTVMQDDFVDHVLGYSKPKDSSEDAQVLGSYLRPSEGEATWFGKAMKIKFYNRSLSAMYKALQSAGFTVTDMQEPAPLEEAKEHDYRLWKVYSEIPMFVVWMVIKPA